MRVLIITHYYPPERGAPQTRLHETARGLQALGHDIRVLTGPPHYPHGAVLQGYHAYRSSHETIDDVPVRRLPVWVRRNGGLVDRTIDQASFAVAAMAAVGSARWADVLLVESPPLFLALTAAWHRIVARRPYVYHVADPWPDFPIAMGALRSPFVCGVAFRLEALAYRNAALVTTVTPGLVDLLAAKPSARGRVRLLPNGVDVERFQPGRAAAAARTELGWPEARLTLVYVGSVGLAQGVGTLIEAAAPLGQEGVVVHVIGSGFERDRLAAETHDRGLEHIRFASSVAAQDVPTLLAAADGVLVMLRRGPLYDHSLPTKLVEGLAAGRPLVVSAGGDAAAIVAGSRAGISAPAEDPDALRRAILKLRDAPNRPAMGQAARRLAEKAYDRRVIVAQLANYLAEAVSSRVRQ